MCIEIQYSLPTAYLYRDVTQVLQIWTAYTK